LIQVESYRLWLGHAGDARDVAKILECGIEAVVQLAIEEPPVQLTRELICIRVPLHDGTGNSSETLRFAVNTVEQLLRLKIPTLVCCSGGMSRSPAVTSFAIARLCGQSPAEVLEQMRSARPADVSPVLWNDLTAGATR
jgi:protein-tyrosine phosphatase